MSQEEKTEKPKKIRTLAAIGRYCGGVVPKTIQTWASEEEFPLHGAMHGKQPRYYAFQHEVDAWLHDREEKTPAPVADGSREDRRWLYAAVVVLATMASAILLWFQFRKGPPERCDVEGSYLEVFDARNRPLWHKSDRPDARLLRVQRPGSPRCLIQDLDGDSEVEVYYNYAAADFTVVPGYLARFSKTGKELWRFYYGDQVVSDGREFDRPFTQALIAPVSHAGKSYLAVASHHTELHPAQVVLINPENGAKVGEYWHPGWFYDIAVVDFDGDGEDELVLVGVNNAGEGAAGRGALAVLDIPFATRSAESGSENYYGPENAKEIAYVLFSQADHWIDGAGYGLAFVSVEDGGFRVQTSDAGEGDHFWVSLDGKLRVTNVTVSDHHRLAHDVLHRQGVLDHLFGERDIVRLGAVIHFETVPDANSKEVNRLFEQAIAARLADLTAGGNRE